MIMEINMKIFRGLKDISFSKINPYHTNESDHTYGSGTSYAELKSLAEEYCNSLCVKRFGWILTYEYNPSNPFYVSEKHFVDLESFGETTDMFYKNTVIASNKLASLLRDDGYDCAIFDYDENDSHVLILKEGSLELEQIELFTEDQLIVNFLKTLNIPFDGTIFIVPINLIKIVDDFLETI